VNRSFRSRQMKTLREILRTLLMIGGAVLLIAALFPLINPGKFALVTKMETTPFLYYVITLPIPILMLTGAWLLNSKKQKLDTKD
jgi:uncharacterized membrane protein